MKIDADDRVPGERKEKICTQFTLIIIQLGDTS
jgi:hypothetical protein